MRCIAMINPVSFWSITCGSNNDVDPTQDALSSAFFSTNRVSPLLQALMDMTWLASLIPCLAGVML